MKSYVHRPKMAEKSRVALKAYPELLQELLYSRDLDTEEKSKRFLNPDFETDSHDPFLMKGMKQAVSRLVKAIKEKERITIWADYDADGVPGAVVLHDILKKAGYENFDVYIPSRNEEGFGLNNKGLAEVADRGTKLIITVDCGINDGEEVVFANSRGMEVIITDHHVPGDILPEAHTILNPKQAGCMYPDKMICGAAVAFKLASALVFSEKLSLKKGVEKWLLDMVGIATISDMVPLQGENRVFAYWGLAVLRKSPRPGLQKLLAKAKINQHFLTEDDIGFTIAPRINAASRMGVPMDAFRLLSTTNEAEAGALAEHLNEINDQRKGTVAAMVKEMKKILHERHGDEKLSVVVIGNPKWKPSLLGLAANTLAEEYGCPAFVWGREGGTVLKGSCRSDGKTNLVAVMRALPDGIFLECGGHALSGGFSISIDGLSRLEEELRVAIKKNAVEGSEPDPEYIDRQITLHEINWDAYKIVEQMAPFGLGNPKPVFLISSARLSSVRKFGKENNHREFSFLRDDGMAISAIAFFVQDDSSMGKARTGDVVDIVGSLEKSIYGRKAELRLRIIYIINNKC